MTSNNFDITTLEKAFRDVVKNGGVSSHVIYNRPKAKMQESEFVVVMCTSRVEDLATYGECNISVSLFAKDNQSEKNRVKLGMMYDTLVGCMPPEIVVTEQEAVIADYLVDLNPTIHPDLPDDFGFHARTIEYSVTIKNL